MGLGLRNIIASLLTEDAIFDKAKDAIDNKYHVRIRYDDGDAEVNGSKRSRVIQPMAIGKTKAGHPCIRAFQVSGNSRRGAPKWKLFRLDRIMSWTPMPNKTFNSPQDGYNPLGDKTMGTFYGNARFANDMTPLERERMKTRDIANAPKVSTKNTSGPITTASQQWKKNVFTSQPNSKKYSMYAKNIKDTEKDFNRFDDDIWAKAEQEANPTHEPIGNKSGPIEDDDYEYDF